MKVVVPGHGPVGTDLQGVLADERRYLEMLVNEVRAHIKKGDDISVAVETVGETERDKWLLWDQQHKRNVSRAYTELEWE